MLAYLALAVFLGMAGFDAFFTQKRLSDLGVGVELNRFTTSLARRWPLGWAVWVSVGVPSVLIGVFGLFCHPMLYYMTGARSTLFAFQLLEIERSGRSKRL